MRMGGIGHHLQSRYTLIIRLRNDWNGADSDAG